MTLKVAVTVEQFWHPVPGGTARATHKTVRALQRFGDIDLVGVAAAHRDNAGESHDLTIPVCHSRLPRPALYESWLRLERPRIEGLTGACDVVWASAMVPPPRSSAAMVSTVHDLEFLDHPEWHDATGTSLLSSRLRCNRRPVRHHRVSLPHRCRPMRGNRVRSRTDPGRSLGGFGGPRPS